MLDFNINLEFNPEPALIPKGRDDCLVITSCAVHLFSDNRIWSGFDEMCFSDLNYNNYNLGAIDFEIGFAGYTGTPYPKVYTKCFALRTDNGLWIKPMKFDNHTCESKINHRGETVIGIRYYFKDEREIELLQNSKRLMFESYFALGNHRKAYAFMCQLCKEENGWKAEYANTYRNTGNDSIKNMID